MAGLRALAGFALALMLAPPASGTTVTQIEAGDSHTCVLLSGGTVRCWGQAGYGQLGYGNTNAIGDNETPATVGDVEVGGAVAQIATGGYHTCALLTNGSVRCWGQGNNGQLGYGRTNGIGDNETPASVGDVPVGGNVTLIAAGASHTCAVLTNGSVRCWGSGSMGQLGYGRTNDIGDNETPASVGDVPVGGNVTHISLGQQHTCAVLVGGTVRCWGAGTNGRLGYANTNNIGDNETPASAGNVTIGGPVSQVAAGQSHTCALLTNGSVRCWGGSTGGRLGFGTGISSVGDNETPASVGDVPVGGIAHQIATGSYHTCAVLSDGGLRCWGTGSSGQLGYGNTDDIGDNETPASVGNVPVGGAVAQIATGQMHTCALLVGGAVRCWGFGSPGWLGYGNTNDIGDDETPASVGDVLVFPPSPSSTPTPSSTSTGSNTGSSTGTPSGTPSSTPTGSNTGTPSGTPSGTPTSSRTTTPTPTRTASPTCTSSVTPSASATASHVPSSSVLGAPPGGAAAVTNISPTPAIAGGVVGGAAVIAVIIILLVVLARRRSAAASPSDSDRTAPVSAPSGPSTASVPIQPAGSFTIVSPMTSTP